MFIFNLFSSAFLIFNFLRFLPCILLQRLFYYGSEAIEWFILLNYCVNPFDFSLETYLDLVLTQKNRTKLSFIQCTVPPPPNNNHQHHKKWGLMRMMSAFSLSLVGRWWWWWWWWWYPEYLSTKRIPIGIRSVGILGVCHIDKNYHHHHPEHNIDKNNHHP